MKVIFTILSGHDPVNGFFELVENHCIQNVAYMIKIKEKRSLIMQEIFILVGFLVFWVVLQKYILPRLGVST